MHALRVDPRRECKKVSLKEKLTHRPLGCCSNLDFPNVISKRSKSDLHFFRHPHPCIAYGAPQESLAMMAQSSPLTSVAVNVTGRPWGCFGTHPALLKMNPKGPQRGLFRPNLKAFRGSVCKLITTTPLSSVISFILLVYALLVDRPITYPCSHVTCHIINDPTSSSG